MNTETNSKEKAQSPFKRKARIGHNFLNTREGTNYYKILNYEMVENKQGEVKPFFTAMDLNTGEEGLIFVDGGLKGQFSRMGLENAVGKSFEITHKGTRETTLFDERGKEISAKINFYEVFELDTTN